MKAKKAKVPVADWVADVRSTRRGKRADTERKVKTAGTKRMDISDVIDDARQYLRNGYEVRFACGERGDAIRLYPCLDANFSQMFAAAQTMGALRSCIGDIPFRIVRRDGMDVEGAKEEREQAQKEAAALRKASVTPDTMVTCPACGFEFRVGRKQAQEEGK